MTNGRAGDASTITTSGLQSWIEDDLVSRWRIGLATIVGLLVIYWLFSKPRLHPREPPFVRSKIPLIGHILGLMKHQIEYFTLLSNQVQRPIFSIDVGRQRMYIVTAPSLIQQCYRNSRALDFDKFVIENSKRMFNLSDDLVKIFEYQPPNDELGYLDDPSTSAFEKLQPGPSLLQITTDLLTELQGAIGKLTLSEDKPIMLYRWFRDNFTTASVYSLYGPNHPFAKNPELVDGLWAFEEDLLWLLPGIWPNLLAAKAYKGRKAIQDAFLEYYEKGYNRESSSFIQGRAHGAMKHGFTQEQVAIFEISIPFVANTNSVPTAFWMMTYILSDPKLTADVREEVESIVMEGHDSGQSREMAIQISRIQDMCPLLASIWSETLRVANNQCSIRRVLTDTILDETYLLRKGTIVQIPSGTTHNSTRIWGENVDTFDAYRFARRDKLPRGDIRKQQTQGFFPFGGGKHLCPGRHFAFAEVVGVTAMLVYGFDITMTDGSPVKVPPMQTQKFGVGVRKPAQDIEVKIKRRQGFEFVDWKFS